MYECTGIMCIELDTYKMEVYIGILNMDVKWMDAIVECMDAIVGCIEICI
jgi:hypothetical protein